MKFLEKFEDLINEKLIKLFELIKAKTPQSFFSVIHFVKDFPKQIKKLIQKVQPKLRVYKLKTIGYFEHYSTFVRGQITAFFIYIRSPEFKNNKKEILITRPLQFIKFHPIKFITNFAFLSLIGFILFKVFLTSKVIIVGTKKLRAPASAEATAEVIDYVDFEKIKFIIPGNANSKESITFLGKVTIKPTNQHDLSHLEHDKEKILEEIMKLDTAMLNLPISDLDKEKIEKTLKSNLESFFQHHNLHITLEYVHFQQQQSERPVYYRQVERMLSFQNFDLQMFLEDTKRNKQIYLDFSVLASNRNVINFLKENEFLLRDRLSTNVEPIIPQLPIEEEGRRIIKDKLKDEINEVLSSQKIEGKILEVYLDYIITN